MVKQNLCATCSHSILCRTWSEYKCRVKERRIYYPPESTKDCSNYKKRDKNFKESKCQCKDCLANETLLDEDCEG